MDKAPTIYMVIIFLYKYMYLFDQQFTLPFIHFFFYICSCINFCQVNHVSG